LILQNHRSDLPPLVNLRLAPLSLQIGALFDPCPSEDVVTTARTLFETQVQEQSP